MFFIKYRDILIAQQVVPVMILSIDSSITLPLVVLYHFLEFKLKEILSSGKISFRVWTSKKISRLLLKSKAQKLLSY